MRLLELVEHYLNADATLMALLTGGIYSRRLMQAGPDVYGSTPNAFSNTVLGTVKPSLVLRNEPRSPRPGREGAFAENHPIALWVYVPATADGKTALSAIGQRLRVLLNGWHYPTESGNVGSLAWSGQTGYRDAPEFTGTLVDTIRFVGVALTMVPA